LRGELVSTLGLILVVVLILALLAAEAMFPIGAMATAMVTAGIGLVGVILIIVVILLAARLI
jgi:hypothetical protein